MTGATDGATSRLRAAAVKQQHARGDWYSAIHRPIHARTAALPPKTAQQRYRRPKGSLPCAIARPFMPNTTPTESML